MTAYAAAGRGAVASIARRFDSLSEGRFAALVSLPGFGLLALSVLAPVCIVVVMSLMRIELTRGDDITFSGLRNYQRMAEDRNLAASLPVTAMFTAATVLVSIPIALGAALLLARRMAGMALLAVAMLLPWAIAPVVTGVYWSFIFQSQFGLATAIANASGLADGPVPWLQQTSSALAVAVVATVWRTVPLLALIILAALRRIPETVVRAARADGASSWSVFRFITLPSIRGSIVLAAVLQIIMSLQVFDTIYTLTGGGPGRSTTVLIYYIFEAAFKQLSLGYSSALAIALTAIIGICSLPLVLPKLRAVWGRRRRDDSSAAVEPVPDPVAVVVTSLTHQPRLAVPTPARPFAAGSRRRIGERATRLVAGIAVVVLIVWSLGPILWIGIASLQHEGSVTSVPLSLGPPTLSNFEDLLTQARQGTFGGALPWLRGISTSAVIAILATIITIVASILIAYPLARLAVPFKRALMVAIVGTQMVPSIVLAIPLLFIFRAIALDDTVAGLAIASAAFHVPLIVWLLRSAFEAVPRSLEWAARMDGCSRLGTIFRVSVPAARASILAAVVLVLIGTWNEFLFAVVLGGSDTTTVMRLIGTVEISSGPTGRAPFTLLAAAGVLAVLPVIALVALFQKNLVTGLTEVHVKG